ncbi:MULTISPECIES: hypothetical protein [unclassified Pseudoalteromonas]|uniref:hypothetical protein n=1 Tax=unclassified Pseudoalteromonas TaxID=194690 RepID=UPI0020984C3C|nr:hypothetical protein [Pseudoalteromonas sp. XMcav2-N]MCO7188584.1 hypothetical protein [Pseudoalteromonas sp. XMcav2-N]
MFSTLLLVAGVQFGVAKACNDPDIELLDEPISIVEPIQEKGRIFEPGTILFNSSLPSACSVINTEGTVEFDVSDAGKVINLKILSINPPRIHSRVIVRGLKKATVLSKAYGTVGNKVHVKYIQFKNKT